MFCNLADDRILRNLLAIVVSVGGIAVSTAEVAARSSNENGRQAYVRAFALDGIEDFVDLKQGPIPSRYRIIEEG